MDAVPDLGPDSRIMDVGSGTGCLIPFFRDRGMQDILAVDLSANMLAKVHSVCCQCKSARSILLTCLAWCIPAAAADSIPYVGLALIMKQALRSTPRCRVDAHYDRILERYPLQAEETYGSSSTSGNEPGVRTWVGDVESVPAFQVSHILPAFYSLHPFCT